MQNESSWRILTGLSLLVLLMSGCLIVSEEHNGEEHCYTDCQDYQVCQPYCDAYSCWDECWWEESCETVCESGGEYPDDNVYEPAECYSDYECGSGKVCVNNKCSAADTDERGSAGLCQACEGRQDCMEEGALCLRINHDEDSGYSETVCGRVCESDPDCPGGFVCVEVDGDESKQCVPTASSDGARSCEASQDLECVSAADCSVGESCVDNSCQDTSSEPDCVAGDCANNEMCIDGECVKDTEPESCVYNADCSSSDDRCVDGQCSATCSADGDCGTNERCRQGICEYVECYQTSDCSAGNICVEASCEQGCDDSSDCSFGYQCSGFNFCEPDPQVECRSSAECSSNEQCSDQGECETPCQCNNQCDGDDICNEGTGICEDPGASGDDGIEC